MSILSPQCHSQLLGALGAACMGFWSKFGSSVAYQKMMSLSCAQSSLHFPTTLSGRLDSCLCRILQNPSTAKAASCGVPGQLTDSQNLVDALCQPVAGLFIMEKNGTEKAVCKLQVFVYTMPYFARQIPPGVNTGTSRVTKLSTSYCHSLVQMTT